jgi:TonB family protein
MKIKGSMLIFNTRKKFLKQKALIPLFMNIGLLAAFMLMPLFAEAAPKAFAYVSKNYIITAEADGERSFVLNFINLSDYVLVVQPSEFIYRGASGRYYIGQVFEREHKDLRGEEQRYTASILLKAHSFTGLNIAGAFREQEEIEELSIRIGAKRYFMQPLDKIAFDQLAKKIGNLDLEDTDSAPMLEAANISEMGSTKKTDGTAEWDRDWQGLITAEGVNPPKILKRPGISATPEAIKAHTYGKVKLSGIINKNGGIQDLKIIRGLGRGLDERAIEGIKNSWVFLPATKNGDVIETQISIEVEFLDPDKK